MDIKGWKKRYQREKEARKSAEVIGENKTREIFYRNAELTRLAESLDKQVKDRTLELEQKNKFLEESRDQLAQQQSMLKDVNAALNDKASKLEAVSQHKSEFLANMSHELRTPLNSLMILAGLLLENSNKNLTGDDLQSVRIIYNNATELLEIIEDILDISKAEVGELSINKMDFLLSDVQLSIKDQFEPLATEKDLQFDIVCEEGLPEWIHTDKKRLKQVIKNLLSNAFKFTPAKGQVILTIKKEVLVDQEHDVSEGLAFEVRDTGIGIPADKYENIFQMFKQVDGSTNRKYGGTGLGLAISRKLARLMNGDLILKSEEGKGACFTFKLSSESLITVESHKSSDNKFFVNGKNGEDRPFNNETILLVDDDLRNSFALSVLLQKHGLNVVLAENGVQALGILEQEDIDLLLLDMMMPTLDGYEVLTRIRGRIGLCMLPVVMLTASDSREDEVRCRSAGADDYLLKPIEVSLLLDRLHSWLGH